MCCESNSCSLSMGSFCIIFASNLYQTPQRLVVYGFIMLSHAMSCGSKVEVGDGEPRGWS